MAIHGRQWISIYEYCLIFLQSDKTFRPEFRILKETTNSMNFCKRHVSSQVPTVDATHELHNFPQVFNVFLPCSSKILKSARSKIWVTANHKKYSTHWILNVLNYKNLKLSNLILLFFHLSHSHQENKRSLINSIISPVVMTWTQRSYIRSEIF